MCSRWPVSQRAQGSSQGITLALCISEQWEWRGKDLEGSIWFPCNKDSTWLKSGCFQISLTGLLLVPGSSHLLAPHVVQNFGLVMACSTHILSCVCIGSQSLWGVSQVCHLRSYWTLCALIKRSLPLLKQQRTNSWLSSACWVSSGM